MFLISNATKDWIAKKYIIVNFQAHFPTTQQTDLQKDGWKEFDKNLSIFQGLLSYTLLWLAPIQEACFLPKEIKARINNKHPSVIYFNETAIKIMKLSKPIKWQIYRENTTHCGSYMLLFTMISFFYSSQLISKNLSNNEDFNLPPKFVINFEKPELHWHYLSSAFWVNRSIWWNCSYSGNYYYSKRLDWCAQLLKI